MNLENRVKQLEDKLAKLEKSDRYTFEKLIQMLDGRNMQVGKTTGTKIGTESTQKIGFYGVTPIVQATLATGASHTVDDVITALQSIGIVKQS